MSRNLLIERLFELLISGDHQGARRLIEEAIEEGLTFQSLAQDAYMPLIRMINALHRAEQLTNLAHDYATEILASLVDDARRSGRNDVGPARESSSPEWMNRLRFCPAPAADRSRTTAQASPQHHTADCGCGSHADGHRGPELHLAIDGQDNDAPQFVFFSASDDVLTARLNGPSIGEREVPIINTEINDILRTFGPRIQRLVLDLSDVRVMSSMALGMCLDVRRRAAAMGIRTSATGLTGEMAKLFRRLKIDGGNWRQRITGGVSGLLGRKVAMA